MIDAVGGSGSPLREGLLGVHRIVKELKTDEARAAVLGAAVDKMAQSNEIDPGLKDLASRMKEIVKPSLNAAMPLQDARIRSELLQFTVQAALSGLPMGPGVALAVAARGALGENPSGEGAVVLRRTLEQIAPRPGQAPGDPAAFLAQVALGGSEAAGADAVPIGLATLKAIADLSNAPAPSETAASQGDSLVNEQLMYCQGKNPERLRDDLRRRIERFDVVIGTKASREQFEAIRSDPNLSGKRVSFDEASRVLLVESGDRPKQGLIVQVVGGDQDLAIAREAGSIAEAMGNRVERISAEEIYQRQDLLQSANVVLSMCGADPDLPNVVAGLTDRPVIATPTKELFGVGLEGAQNLIQHMNQAAQGVSFVNIDNGFGAAYVADKINRQAESAARNPSDERNFLVVTTAGSADIPVAEQAALAAEALGERVVRLYDHGVNDPDGLQKIEGAYRQAKAVIVAAGLEGGLPNHVAAVTRSPVVAVPTSVGYGTGQGGVAAMLCALNACAPGITVVAIDAALKAAQVAHKISSQRLQS